RKMVVRTLGGELRELTAERLAPLDVRRHLVVDVRPALASLQVLEGARQFFFSILHARRDQRRTAWLLSI
ncbi:MAG TPA: hypothetical protein VGI56_14065, partial [Galbitalea sp.]